MPRLQFRRAKRRAQLFKLGEKGIVESECSCNLHSWHKIDGGLQEGSNLPALLEAKLTNPCSRGNASTLSQIVKQHGNQAWHGTYMNACRVYACKK